MIFREVLQTELWSKRTTRRILFGIAIIVLGIVVFLRVTSVWITPMERKVANQALVSIDALQAGTDVQFEDMDSLAKKQVDAAQQGSLTLRDHQISEGLFFYLAEIELVRREQQRRNPRNKSFEKLARPEDHRIEEAVRQSHEELGRDLHHSLN